MAALLAAEPGVLVLNEVVLNQVLVRFHAPGIPDGELTRRVIARVQEDGTCWLGGSTWHGDTVMRLSFVNWSTGEADVERAAAAILHCFHTEVSAGGTN